MTGTQYSQRGLVQDTTMYIPLEVVTTMMTEAEPKPVLLLPLSPPSMTDGGSSSSDEDMPATSSSPRCFPALIHNLAKPFTLKEEENTRWWSQKAALFNASPSSLMGQQRKNMLVEQQANKITGGPRLGSWIRMREKHSVSTSTPSH